MGIYQTLGMRLHYFGYFGKADFAVPLQPKSKTWFFVYGANQGE